MRSKLVVKSAKLDFGKVVADEDNVLWKELVVYNEGSKEGIFQVSFPATNMILKIDPMSGNIASGGKQMIIVSLLLFLFSAIDSLFIKLRCTLKILKLKFVTKCLPSSGFSCSRNDWRV